MKEEQKTTQKKCIAIVRDCRENGSTAIKYNMSYQQVYIWVKKIRELGEAGFVDRGGKRIADQKPRIELEKA